MLWCSCLDIQATSVSMQILFCTINKTSVFFLVGLFLFAFSMHCLPALLLAAVWPFNAAHSLHQHVLKVVACSGANIQIILKHLNQG